MNIKYRIIILLMLTISLLAVIPARAQTGQVRVVYFTSPVCSFCQLVEERDLPPLEAQYGAQLHILRVDTTTTAGQRLFQTTLERYAVAPNRQGTPMMLVNDTVLVGAVEIPEQLPGLVAELLAAGGNDWPPLSGLENFIEADMERAAAGDRPLWRVRFERDLPGNYISVALLVIMLGVTVVLAWPAAWRNAPLAKVSPWIKIAIALIGLSVAIYLSYVETTQTEAFCGPVGQCNVVQQSRFALLFGFLPMALFGALGYTAVLGTYIYGRWGKGLYAGMMPLASFLLAAFGFVFSLWLTYLQPFVIGATCLWCLASAVTMTLSALLNAAPGWGAVQLLSRRGWSAYQRAIKQGAVPTAPTGPAVKRAAKRRKH